MRFSLIHFSFSFRLSFVICSNAHFDSVRGNGNRTEDGKRLLIKEETKRKY